MVDFGGDPGSVTFLNHSSFLVDSVFCSGVFLVDAPAKW